MTPRELAEEVGGKIHKYMDRDRTDWEDDLEVTDLIESAIIKAMKHQAKVDAAYVRKFGDDSALNILRVLDEIGEGTVDDVGIVAGRFHNLADEIEQNAESIGEEKG